MHVSEAMQSYPDMPKLSISLLGRHAVVTGGGSGIGREIAKFLSGSGCRVAIIDVDQEKADACASELRARGGEALCFMASVADADAVRRVFASVEAAWGRIDILVNNAGVSGNKPTLELSDEDWRRCLSINLDGVFFCSRAAGGLMRKVGGGTIINIGSIYSIVAAPNRLHYCASKAAVAMLTRSLAIEWASLGIRVNCVAPGYVETGLIQELSEAGLIDLEQLKQRTPQKRLAKSEEIAAAVAWLCSDHAAHVTGQTLAVDGGWTAYGYV
jgi:NAD(P)-dependent dehydrogenase (short-subunit alcohol dehydrogenase family)